MRYVADEVAKKVHGAEQMARAEKEFADLEGVELYHRHEPTYATRLIAMKNVPDTRDIPLTAFRIGDLGIVAIPFEVFAEIGLGIRERSPLATTFTISHAGGSFGYLPTEALHALGGYETSLGTNFAQKDAAARISDRMVEMLEKLK
jgi:neutral ceramidase